MLCCDLNKPLLHNQMAVKAVGKSVAAYSLRMNMSFSKMFKTLFNSLPTTPKLLVMPRRFSMSYRLIDLVNKIEGTRTIKKIITPKISSTQLEKLSCEIAMKVTDAAIADETRIFAEERQSTVTP